MTGNTRRWLPAAVVVLAVTALGVAARRDGGLDAGAADGLAQDLRPLAAVLAVLALVVVAVNFAKHRDDGYGPLHRAGTATAVLLVLAAVLTPIGLMFLGRHKATDPPQSSDDGTATAPETRSQSTRTLGSIKPGSHSSAADFISATLLLLVVIGALVLLCMGIYHLLIRRRLARLRLPVLQFADLDDTDLEQLADAVAAGSDALAYQGDAREAVIACYAAMEEALGADGNGRREADTPEDFLQRVTGARLIPGAPARRLTELFREARFSRHPVDETQREQAREALASIAEHLRDRAAQAQERVDAARAAEAARAAGATGAAGAAGAAGPSSAGGRR